MKIKKEQLKDFIKQVVREAISEREYKDLLMEVSPPGAKAERMIQHVKSSLRDTHPNWSEDKITSVAIATAWKAHSAGNLQEVAPEGWEGTVKAMKKEPGIDNPWALAHWMKGKGMKSHKQDEQVGADVVAGEGYQTDEAGLTSEMGPEHRVSMLDDIVKVVIQKKGTDNPEAVKYLVSKVFEKSYGKPADPEAVDAAVAKQIPVQQDEATYKVASPNETDTAKENKALTIQTDPKVTEGKKKYWMKDIDPEHKGYCTPMTKSTCTPRRKAFAKRAKKGEFGEQKSVKETKVNMKMGPSYKTVPDTLAKVTEPDQPARTVQYDPKVNETAYKVQGRSYKTFEDSPKGDTAYKDDPENA